MRCLEIRRGIIGLFVGRRDRSVVTFVAVVVWSGGQVPCPTYGTEPSYTCKGPRKTVLGPLQFKVKHNGFLGRKM